MSDEPDSGMSAGVRKSGRGCGNLFCNWNILVIFVTQSNYLFEMSEENNDISRRDWLRTVAATVVAGSVAGGVLSSCRRGNDDWLPLRADARGEDKNPFDADVIVAALPGEVRCVGCNRCMPCSFGVDIPSMYKAYNEAVRNGEIPVSGKDYRNGGGAERCRAFVDRIEEEIGDRHIAHRCAGCGKCDSVCPMKLPIAEHLRSIGRLIDLTREETDSI